MKRLIRTSEEVRTFRNKRNPNKFIETKKYDDGHTVARQYIQWEDTPTGRVRNYTGAADAHRGRWFRHHQDTLNDILDDYDEYDVPEGWDKY